ncbi:MULTISPECIES: helix-turn-helix transcriptional regulator [unclassified Modestobacter]|uniref:helix-turn-helix transcriptional regulator n=1 Tax=unclassified Modestobacter TaxID=2643866 RepID=UPI0022AAD0DC|nr:MULTISPECIES: helix-turn-helix transcriptional regulator [unclassified Modestobacter]MCZ2824315.1 helix-turn-helix transcriptional regulator [Modestobacter sp. VKM Ac-2981]MCZ2854157.1 helix-turn-helix transcriptional regulator [Modestobacter sp. VKM Ac-2982]
MVDRGDFAALLRAWRERLQPAAVGFPTGQRRTAGLRREEVALLAGVSVDYLVRLEQGRAARPSAQVVASLARVLQLSDLERDQLHLAAGLPAPLPSAVPTHIPASVQRLLARLPDVAIGVWTAHWTLLTANAAWRSLLGEMDPGLNLLVAEFTGTAPQVVWSEGDHERHERALVSDLRSALIRYPDDRSAQAVLAELRGNERFARLWAEGTVTEHRVQAKTFLHPLVGEVTLDCDVFTVIGTDLRIVTYTAEPGTGDASRFDLVRTLGVAEVSPGLSG